jgi:hypothetical protein
MLYKVSPFGYFARVSKVSKGPWFNESFAEEDGLEYFYTFGSGGEAMYLLSNNIPFEDREAFQRLYYSLQRNKSLAWFGGIWLGFETVSRVRLFKGMAIGWKALSLIGAAYLYKSAFTAYNSVTYGPIVSAFFRKHNSHAKSDIFDITDRKREYYEIDTRQYMKYDYSELGHEYHAHHGPQPVRNTYSFITFNLLINVGWRNPG